MFKGLLDGLSVQYIIALSVLGVFVLALIIFLVVYGCAVNRKNKQMREIEKMYTDKNLVKMDYDFAMYDEDEDASETVISSAPVGEEEIKDDVIFGRVDKEGLEEITGNYNPNK